jgi:hypothetical protein
LLARPRAPAFTLEQIRPGMKPEERAAVMNPDQFRKQIYGEVRPGKLTKGQIQMIRWAMKAVRRA